MKGQVSLEWLIIISVVLIVAGLAVYLVSSGAGSQAKSVQLASCKQAATTCKMNLRANSQDPCMVCTDQCQDQTTGNDLLKVDMAVSDACKVAASACGYCKLGKPEMIYENACVKNKKPNATITSVPASCTVASNCTLDGSTSADAEDATLDYLWIISCPGKAVTANMASGPYVRKGASISLDTFGVGQGHGAIGGGAFDAGTGGLVGGGLGSDLVVVGTFGWGVVPPSGAQISYAAKPTFNTSKSGTCNVTLYVRDDCLEVSNTSTTVSITGTLCSAITSPGGFGIADCKSGVCVGGKSCGQSTGIALNPCACK